MRPAERIRNAASRGMAAGAALAGLTRRKKFHQVGVLYLTMVLGVAVGVVISVFNTRLLGPRQFGDFRFLLNLFTFFVTFMTLGLFVSGGRLIALRENEPIKDRLVGTLFVIAAVISLALIALLMVFSFFEEAMFRNQLGGLLRVFSPLLFVYPFQLCLESILSGDNRIYELAAFRLLPRIVYLGAAFAFNLFVPLSLFGALLFQLGSLAVVVLFFILALKPRFADVQANLSRLWQANRTHGLPVYVGTVASVATAHLGGITIGLMLDNVRVGLYSLAVTITEPLVLISGSVATTWFKDFANRRAIPRRATVVTVVLSLAALVAFLLLVEPVILLLYSSRFAGAIPLAVIIAVGSVVHGFGDFLNRFIGAHGVGRYNRNGAIAVGVCNVLGYTLLIRFMGVSGAATTRVVSAFVYLGMMIVYYRRLTRSLQAGADR